MSSEIKKTKVSLLPEASTLDGFYAFGTDGSNNSVKVPIGMLRGNSPHIGANGNWYVGDIDLGVHAQGEPGKDGADGGLQIVSDGETISNDGEYLMVSNGTITISTSVDPIPQSALSIPGALLPNGTFNGTSGYYHTPVTDIPAGKTKMQVVPLPDNLGGRSLAFYTSAGAFISTIPNTATDTPVLVDIPSNAAKYALCRSILRDYFAGFVSDGTQTYTNTGKIVLIKMVNGAAAITELHNFIDPNQLVVVSNGETIKTDGQYLFIEDGSAQFVYEVAAASEIVIPKSDLKISGYIRDDGELMGSGSYSRTEIRDIPKGAAIFEVYSCPDGSRARPIAFYDENDLFISAPDNKGIDVIDAVTRPAAAAKYALSQNSIWTYGCTIKIAGTQTEVKNENAITLVKRKGDIAKSMVLRDFSKSSIKVPNHPKAFLKDFLLNSAAITTGTISITGTGSATANQLRYKAYLSTENIYFDVSFKANANSDIRIGRSEGGSFKLAGNILTVYNYQNVEFASFTLPFSIVAGKSYSVSLDKPDALNTLFTISSASGETFTVPYNKLTSAVSNFTCWGVPFFGVINGDITVRNAVLSFKYDYNTVLSIYGDSYIEGNSLLTLGGIYNKWSSLLGDKMGTPFVHISGKGGELANASFVSRFKVENSLFKSPYVILALGTNNTDLATYTTYMQQMIDECRANGQVPILQTIPPRQGVTYTTYTKLVNDWVKASGELYVDFNAALTKPDDESVWIPKYMMSDGVHPTVDGHAAMFEQVKRDLNFLI